MNPYPAALMKPLERRAELCAILARGLCRLRMNDAMQLSSVDGESSLHFAPDQSGHATTQKRRVA